MTFMKDHIIEVETDILERFWEHGDHGIRDAFPDEAPASIYDVEDVMGKDAGNQIYEAISATAYDDLCDKADNMRKRTREEAG